MLRCSAQEYGIAGYTLLMSLIEYKTLVMRDDFEGASAILPTIPQVQTPMLIRATVYPVRD